MLRFFRHLAYFALLAFMAVPLVLPLSARALTVSPVLTELAAAPGQQIRAKFVLTNEQRDTKTYYFSALNFNAKDESGIPQFSPKKEALAAWVQIQPNITLGPNEQREVAYTVTIPLDAEPGGYFASIFASSNPPEEQKDGDVSLGSQLGTLVLLRVAGTITESVDILEFFTVGRRKVFLSLPVDFYFRFQNSGQSWVKPVGDVVIENTLGNPAAIMPANPEGSNVLPKSIRRFELSWLQKTKQGQVQDARAERPPASPEGFWNKARHEWRYFAIGRYTARLSLTYNNDTSTTTQARVSFWVIPWHFLAIAIPAGILALLVAWFLLRRYNRWVVRRAGKR